MTGAERTKRVRSLGLRSWSGRSPPAPPSPTAAGARRLSWATPGTCSQLTQHLTLSTPAPAPSWGHEDFLNLLTDLVSPGPAVLDLPTSPPTGSGTGEECLTWRPPTGRGGREGTGLRDDEIWLIHLLDKYGLHSINVWIHHFPIHLKH